MGDEHARRHRARQWKRYADRSTEGSLDLFEDPLFRSESWRVRDGKVDMARQTRQTAGSLGHSSAGIGASGAIQQRDDTAAECGRKRKINWDEHYRWVIDYPRKCRKCGQEMTMVRRSESIEPIYGKVTTSVWACEACKKHRSRSIGNEKDT